MHRAIVGDVESPVAVGRGEGRVEPQPVDAEPGEVVELLRDPAQVADPVSVRVAERARIDLVEHAVAPPHATATVPPRCKWSCKPLVCRIFFMTATGLVT